MRRTVVNRKQHEFLDVEAHARPLSAAESLSRRADGAVIVDARDPHDFAAGHLRGSLNVPADGRFAERAGMVIEPGAEIIVVAPPGGEHEVITRLSRIGFDTVAGYLKDPEAARCQTATRSSSTAQQAPAPPSRPGCCAAQAASTSPT
jgi:rhodanese-related sulfurtransferase